MKPGRTALVVAATALLLGVVFLVDTRGTPPATAAADPDTRTAANVDRRAASAPASAAPPGASPPSAVIVASASSPTLSTPPLPTPAVAMLSPRTPVTAPPDARVPPIDPPSPDEPERAQPWEVADPALYRAREQRLERETESRFVQASAARLPQLRAAVDEMRARGAAPADIARAEDKIAHMQAVQDALLRGEPLAASAPIVAPSLTGRP